MAITVSPDLERTPSVDTRTPLGLAKLARLAMPGESLAPIGQELLRQADERPLDANVLMDLSLVLELSGHAEQSLAVQAEALALQRVYHRGASPGAPHLLALMSPGNLMANTPLEFLLEAGDVELTRVYLMPDEPLPATLPQADRVFVAVGESDTNRPLLARLARAVRDGRLDGMPVINAPAAVGQLARDTAGALLGDVPGLVVPPTLRTDRATLARLAAEARPPSDLCGTGWPLLVRPIDSHAGQGLARIDDATMLRAHLRAHPLQEGFYATPFVDYRSADGLFRKARVVLIDGRPHLAHLAISEYWMIHYLNAGMAEHPERRAEEARAMAGFDEGFAARHAATFAAIHARLGLDYVGLDCAELADGRLLLFEADTAMVVHAMDPPESFAYKQPAMQRLFADFRAMLARER